LQDIEQGDSNERHRKFPHFAMGFGFLAAVACITLGSHRKDVLSLRSKATLLDVEAPPPPPPPPYLGDWARQCWVECSTTKASCPMEMLDTPQNGCISSTATNRVLLTADGLSSPHVQESFQRVLQSTVEGRTPGRDPADKSIVLVLDGAYDAYKVGTQKGSPLAYCDSRRAELEFLGASDVICVVLDPAAREDLWRTGQEQGGHSKAFGEAMHDINDEYLVEVMTRATVMFVECGSPMILLQNFRRPLNLSRPHSHKSFRDLVRSRVNDDADALAYVGVSSGSSIASETVVELSPAFGTSPSDLESLGGDASGLGLVKNCSFYPHATQTDEPWLDKLARTSHIGVMALPACQPASFTGSNLGRMSHICP